MAVGATSSSSDVNVASSPASSAAADATMTSDRFLKLLVAQMKNQDPLNPMDNAQVTSQMAQINTVTGIDKLNTTVAGLSAQFMQMQAMQGASLVGHDVIVPGNKLDIDAVSAIGQGGFEIQTPADAVKVEILSPSGAVVQTLNLGAQGAGMHSFDWPAGTATDSSGLTLPRHRHHRRRGDRLDPADARPGRRGHAPTATASTSSSRSRARRPTPRSRPSTEPGPPRPGASPRLSRKRTPWASSKVFPVSTPRARTSR